MSASVSELPPGAIVYGRSGIPYEVLECRTNWIRLQRSDGTSIEVKPTAIVRWEFSKSRRAENSEKISSEPSESEIESLEPLSGKTFPSDDMPESYRPNIVRESKVSSENLGIVRSIVRSKTHVQQVFPLLSDGSDDSDDTFKPFSAQANFENFLPATPVVGDRVWHKNTALEFVVIDIYDHFMGWVDGDRTYETWAKLTTDDGRPAHWKLGQLQVM